jgi:hypothetical protein
VPRPGASLSGQPGYSVDMVGHHYELVRWRARAVAYRAGPFFGQGANETLVFEDR